MHSEGGFANDAMINLSETVSGRLTTAFDSVTIALGTFAEKSGLLSAVSGVLEDFTTQLQRASLSEDDLQKSREEFFELRQKLKQAHKGNIKELMAEAHAAEKLAFTLNQVLGSDIAGAHLEGANAFVDKVEELFAFSTTSLSTLPDAPPETGGDNENNVRPQIDQVERGIRVHAKSAKEIENHTLKNRKLKGSYTDLSSSLQPVLNKFHELGAVVGQQLPSFFEGAFTSLMEGTKSFGQFMLQTLQRLLIKAAALAATFVVLSVILGGATGVAEMTGGKAGLGAFMKMGMGVPQMAEGGLFTGASIAQIGEGPGTSMINPEVVAPLDKLKNMIGGGNVNVTGTIRGRDLLLSEERSSYSRRRRFGK